MRTAHKIGWRPPDFWAATLVEFFEAIEAHNDDGSEDGPPSEREMRDLMERYAG